LQGLLLANEETVAIAYFVDVFDSWRLNRSGLGIPVPLPSYSLEEEIFYKIIPSTSGGCIPLDATVVP
jgi:hypothetical protein